MKKLILIYTLFSVFFFNGRLSSQNTDLLLLNQINGDGTSCQVFHSVTDISGNIYAVGQFNSTISQGTISISATGALDGFVAKFNTNGDLIWINQISGPSNEQPNGVVLSNDGNSIYVSTNCVSNPTTFGTIDVATLGAVDIVLAKYDSDDGDLQWVHNTAYSNTNQTLSRLDIDNSGNLIISGIFVTNVTFYGAAISLSTVLPNFQTFIAKFDSDGNTLWAKHIPGDNNGSYIRSVSIDNTGYYFGGTFNGTYTLDVEVLSNTGNIDMFLYKTDFDGNGLWVRTIRGTGSDYLIRHKGNSIGNQYLIGYYDSPTLTIDSTDALPSLQTISNNGSYDIYLSCYSSDGTLQFSKTYGSNGDDQSAYIYANTDHVIFGGYYNGSINFGATTLTNSSTDGYMVETDLLGNVLTAKRAFGTGIDYIKSCLIDNNNANIFIGDFNSATLTVDDKSLTNTSTATRDLFIAKFGQIIVNFAVTNNVCSDGTTGAIDVSVSGDGTAPYSYSWSGPSAFTSTSEDLTGLASGWYKVTITDNLGAIKIDSTQVTAPAPLNALFSVTNTSCATTTDGAINLTSVGGTAPYTFLWSNAAVTEDISGLDIGWYRVTITDANLCSKVDSAQVVHPAAMVASFTYTYPSCGASDGTIDLTVINGNPPYTYLWDDGTTTEDRTNLINGNYSVTITDNNLCTSSGNLTLVAPTAPSLSVVSLNPTCNPGGDGSIDLIITGGTMPYTYLWSDGNTSQDRNTLPAGTYAVTVTDNSSCSTVASGITLTTPASPTLSLIVEEPSCNPGADGTIDLIVYGGTSPYTYVWEDASVNQDRTGLNAGNYAVTVSDANGCTVNASTTLTNPAISASITTSGVTTFCQGASVTLFANTGLNYTYQWNLNGIAILGAVSPSLEVTASGNYSVVVTNSGNCSATSADVTVTVNALPSMYNVTGSGSYCAGGLGLPVGLSSSEIGVTYELYIYGLASGTTLPGDGNPLTFGNQLFGTYTIVASNANCNATMNGSASIIENALPDVTVTSSGATTFCAGGSVSFSVPQAVGNIYQWQLNGSDIAGATTSNYTASASGTYTVIVTNLSSCTATSANQVVTVNALPAMYNVTGSGSYCAGGLGLPVGLSSSEIGVTYELYINGLASGTTLPGDGNPLTFGNQLFGTYTIVASNANCNATMNGSASIIENALPDVTVTSSGATTFCAGGSVSFSVPQAVGNIYQWQLNGSDIAGVTTSNYTASASGTYTVIVTNLSSCSATSANQVVTLTALPTAFNVTGSGTYCNAGTGLPVGLSGSEIGITYELYINGIASGTTLPGDGNPLTFGNQLSGNYTIVASIGSCSAIMAGSAIITEALVLSGSLNENSIIIYCETGANGQATIQVQNGLAPYTYAWSSSASTTQTATDLGVGWQFVTVTDQCGTSIEDSVLVASLPPLEIEITNSVNASCLTSTNGSATVETTFGIAPFTYSWSNSAATTATASDLQVGMQYVTVTDFCGSVIDSVFINYNPLMTASITDSTQVTCSGLTNGSAIVTALQGATPYTYLWSTTETSQTAVQLVEGWNYVTITDVCLTQIIDSVNILVNTPLQIDTIIQTPTTCNGGNDGTATVTISGGTAPITYLWDNGSLNSTNTGLSNDTVYVTVTDACTSIEDSIYVEFLPILQVSVSLDTMATCPLTADGVATAHAQFGSGIYTFVWSNSISTDSIASDLSVGLHYVTVTDACGSYIDSVDVTNSPLLDATLTLLNPASCAGSLNGSAVVSPIDGVAPFTYAWSGSLSTDSLVTDLAVGTVTVTVTDVCGNIQRTIDITQVPSMILTVTSTNLICNNDSTGSIVITPSLGVLPYSYKWADDTLLNDSSRTLLQAGNYIVTVTDGCGDSTLTITVNQPNALLIDTLITHVQKLGETNGAINITVSGGTSPYTYDWSNYAITEDLTNIGEGIYMITVSDANNCEITDTITIISLIKPIEIYSGFTPNDDGKNDVWNIKNIDDYPECDISIFNEWGIKVFHSVGYAEPWDGTKDGKKLPSAVYYYIIDLKEGTTPFSGSVTLMK